MRIAIVGAGALGSVVGGLLIEAGLDTILIERNPQEVRVVAENGLHLEGVSGDRVIRARIVSDPSEAAGADLVLVIVKSYDTRAAVDTVKQAISSDGAVLTLQNGIGNFETLNEAFPGRVLLGTTTVGAMTLGPGHFRHTGFGQTHFGESDGRILDRTLIVAEMLEKMNAGPVHIVDNAVGCVWSKLIINAAINAPATLLRVRNGDLPTGESGKRLIHEIVEECVSIVRAKGIELIFDDPEERVLAVCEGTAPNLNSMFQDVLAGRKTEIDYINNALAAEAERLGIDAPVNRTLGLLIKSLEATAECRVE
ncbi:MAG: 2-dehydropantoate 2-reductase [Desulfomonile tiedjei]|uniref:2-dehydropantoate 2-reductase n=1 Tax=Desulfomonile tiedjei TaxID=2358 RepID=A0A9D6V1S5_9BACT|nr:2-dehydropantoate 2-reductase [Desulfomonile tiedjei]